MNRNNTIDLVKFFAIICVVSIHTTPFKHINIGSIDGANINFLINTFSRFAVPFFFITSGYLLGMNIMRTTSKLKYYKKYLVNLLSLYFSWAFFYLVYDLILKYIQGESMRKELWLYLSSLSIEKLYIEGVSSPNAYQLWFLVAIIYSAIILFVFIKINKVKMLLILSLIMHLIGLFGNGQLYSFLINIDIPARSGIFFSLFYITLGYHIAINFDFFKKNINPKVAFFLFCFFTIIQISERFILSNFYSAPGGEYFLSTIPLTISLFIFTIIKMDIKNLIFCKIGSRSVGIFVLHTFIISLIKDVILGDFLFNQLITESLLGQVIFTPLIVFVSYLFYILLQIGKKQFYTYYMMYRGILRVG